MVCSQARLATGVKMHPCFLLLDDGDVDVLLLHSDLHQPAVDWLPFHQAILHSFLQDDGDSFMLLVIVSATA